MATTPHAGPTPSSAAFRSRLDRVLDWFLPVTLRGTGEPARRARLTVFSSLALMGTTLLVSLVIDWQLYTVPGLPFPVPRSELATLALAAVLGLAVAYTVRQTGSAASAGGLLTATVIVVMLHFSVTTGGFWSPVVWFVGLLPMLSAFLGGPQVQLAATVAATGLLLGLYTVDGMEWDPSRGPDPAAAPRDALLQARLVMVAISAFLGWYYERLGSIGAARLEAANDELKASNDALRVSRLHLRQIAENIGHAIWMEDPSERVLLYVNPAFEATYGIKPARLETDLDAWMSAVHPEDRASIPVRADGEDHLYRVQSGGEDRWVRHASWRAAGTSRRIIHIAADATLKRHAEALRTRFLETVLQVQETERRHLARELHDETGQALTALLVGLRAIRVGVDPKKQAHIDLLSTQLRHVVQDLSRLARGLHPSVLDELGLTAGIERLASDLQQAHGIHVDVHTRGMKQEDALSPQQRLTAYRIVQEALTNVARHARAGHADVSVTLGPSTLEVRVEDDGRGFDAEDATGPSGQIGTGLGLYGMKERAQLLGGHVDIESVRGRGTTIVATLPRVQRPGTDPGLPT